MATDPFLPRRLRQLAAIVSGEQRVQRGWFRAMTSWLDGVRPAVLRPFRQAGLPPDATAVMNQPGTWQRLVESDVIPEIRRLFNDPYGVIAPDADPDTDPYAIAYMAGVRNRLSRIPDEVYAQITADIERGIREGRTVPEIAADIEATLTATGSERWPNRAVMVARTECLPGDTVIEGALATAIYRRWYEGPWVEIITASGRELSGTPNHPVLTRRGWVGLGQITEDDDLVCDSRSVQLPGTSTDHHVQTGPTAIAEVFNAVAAVRIPERVATAQPDFHGDGRDGYVDVLRSYGVLPIGSFSPVDKGRIDGVLTPSDLERVLLDIEGAPFCRSAPVDEYSGRPWGSDLTPSVPNATVYGADARLEFCSECGGAFSRQVPRCYLTNGKVFTASRAVPRRHQVGTGSAQTPRNACASDSPCDGVTTESGGCGYSTTAESRQVELDRVSSVVITERFVGHVYNLTTTDGYFSVNGGIYTGNTIGATNGGAFAAAVQRAIAEGDAEPEKVWISTMDQRTRPTHVSADQQRVPLLQPFTVGGFPLMFPGDPSGPASEVIQCRCSILDVVGGEDLDWTNRQFLGGS